MGGTMLNCPLIFSSSIKFVLPIQILPNRVGKQSDLNCPSLVLKRQLFTIVEWFPSQKSNALLV